LSFAESQVRAKYGRDGTAQQFFIRRQANKESGRFAETLCGFCAYVLLVCERLVAQAYAPTRPPLYVSANIFTLEALTPVRLPNVPEKRRRAGDRWSPLQPLYASANIFTLEALTPVRLPNVPEKRRNAGDRWSPLQPLYASANIFTLEALTPVRLPNVPEKRRNAGDRWSPLQRIHHLIATTICFMPN